MAGNPQVIKATDFKTRCLEIMDEVKNTRQEVIVTKRGKPVVKVLPADADQAPVYGCMRGTAEAKGDILTTGEVWDAAK